MYNVNDYISYGSTGVCRIAEIKRERIRGVTKEYYVLRPVFAENSTVYVPTDNEELVSKIRSVLTCDELNLLLSDKSIEEDGWITNDYERMEKYREIIKGGDRRQVIRIVRSIHRHQRELLGRNKRLHVSDERIKKEAESLICSEVAFIKNITPEKALPIVLGNA